MDTPKPGKARFLISALIVVIALVGIALTTDLQTLALILAISVLFIVLVTRLVAWMIG
jgi:hypothetical protein